MVLRIGPPSYTILVRSCLSLCCCCWTLIVSKGFFRAKKQHCFWIFLISIFMSILLINFHIDLTDILFFKNSSCYFKTSVLTYVQINNLKSSLLSLMEVVFTSWYACCTTIHLYFWCHKSVYCLQRVGRLHIFFIFGIFSCFDVEYIYGFVGWGVCKQSRWRHSVTEPHTRWRICVTMATLWQQQDGAICYFTSSTVQW